ncbi:MAG: DUF433 domain-containing protein [Candidatus Chisholmbacteria bacterium]|nr:DUF433 domain-containing protein [Candidatus Chisholmbacteria bacterium]
MNNIQIPIKDPVTINPNILGGTPVIKGTRIPAALVFELLKTGYSLEIIAKEYPSLSRQKLAAFMRLISTSFDVPAAKAL